MKFLRDRDLVKFFSLDCVIWDFLLSNFKGDWEGDGRA